VVGLFALKLEISCSVLSIGPPRKWPKLSAILWPFLKLEIRDADCGVMDKMLMDYAAG
jgi:hypothetical protein